MTGCCVSRVIAGGGGHVAAGVWCRESCEITGQQWRTSYHRLRHFDLTECRALLEETLTLTRRVYLCHAVGKMCSYVFVISLLQD